MVEPEKKFRAGNVTATVWNNEKEVTLSDGKKEMQNYRSIQVERNYTDKDGNWQKTSSFGVADLPKVELVSMEAYRYIILKSEIEETSK